MEKETLRQRLINATEMLVDFTSRNITNELATNYKYIITPNMRDYSPHLNEIEVKKLLILNGYKNRKLTLAKVIDLLWENGKVPLWINLTVYESSKRETVLDLYCSRRLREDHELYDKIDQYPPFHCLLPFPYYYDPELNADEKFDINWKRDLDEIRNPKTVGARLKKFLLERYFNSRF